MENKEEFKFGEFIKKHPIISMAIGLVVILASVILTMAMLHEDETFKSYMFERHYDTITKSDTIKVSKRFSCTQNQNDAVHIVIDSIFDVELIVTDSIFDVYELYSLFSTNEVYTKDTTVNSYTIKGSSRLTNDTLHIENLTCGDTLTKVDKKPYEDKNFSLIRTRKTYIDSNWQLTTDTSYTNKSPNIKDWELNEIFNDVQAEWTYYRDVNKFVIRMIDENISYTFNTENLALELLNNKCKDKSTIAGKLVYTEYDACKSNNSVRTITVIERSVCGHSNVKLNYNLGSLATAPNNCLGESNLKWSYSW